MKAKGHLETVNHFSIVALDSTLFRESWEKAFDVRIPEMFTPSDGSEQIDISKFFTHKPTYRGGAWPAGKSFGVEQVPVPPLYQPNKRMIEMKSAGAMPSGTAFYEKFGNGIQYMGIIEGENRDPFLDALNKKYGCKKLEEMFYDPLPGDFCIVETEPVLGFNLCVKQDGALNGAVKVILPDTAECTVVVSDIEESVRIWSDIFEIQKPKIVTIREKAMFRGQEIYADFRAARINETPFTLYLVENSNAGPFAEFARGNGYGIHHITFDMGTACESFAAHMKEALDIDILTEYDLGGAHYIVFDSIKKMGAYIAAR